MPNHDNPIIYKIEDHDIWGKAADIGNYLGSPVDLNDGFIHFSTATQTQETAAKHFAGRDNLILAAIDASKLGDKLVWEPSRGGALFPHLYGMLPMEYVVKSWELGLNNKGDHVFPRDFPLKRS